MRMRQRRQRPLAQGEAHAVGVEARDFEERIDLPGQPVGFVDDHVQSVADRRQVPAGILTRQHLGVAFDDAHRGLELVRHH